MTPVLRRLLGRLPIGWLQLTHNPMRFVAALVGVAFANVLVFVQLGIMNSMWTATLHPYSFFAADVMISAPDANALTDGGNVARQWLLQALADATSVAMENVRVHGELEQRARAQTDHLRELDRETRDLHELAQQVSSRIRDLSSPGALQ